MQPRIRPSVYRPHRQGYYEKGCLRRLNACAFRDGALITSWCSSPLEMLRRCEQASTCTVELDVSALTVCDTLSMRPKEPSWLLAPHN